MGKAVHIGRHANWSHPRFTPMLSHCMCTHEASGGHGRRLIRVRLQCACVAHITKRYNVCNCLPQLFVPLPFFMADKSVLCKLRGTSACQFKVYAQ